MGSEEFHLRLRAESEERADRFVSTWLGCPEIYCGQGEAATRRRQQLRRALIELAEEGRTELVEDQPAEIGDANTP